MPNRIIKDSITTSRTVNMLSDFDFRVWIYLITYVDDYGRGIADAELLKGLVFPRKRGITEAQISEALARLANTGMVKLYQVDGEPYFYFPNWDKHQQIRAKKSKFPAPDINLHSSDINCNQMISSDSVCTRNPIQSNPNPNPNPKDDEDDSACAGAREEVVAAYSRKISPQPSTICLSELVGFADTLGAELCIRAMDVAIDAGARNWRYVKAILADWQRRGYKTVADVEQAEAQRSRNKGDRKEPWSFDDF